jgi:4-hydroxy-tetrahydrodipicolinate synthase
MRSIEGVYAAVLTPRRPGMQDVNLGVMWDVIDFLCDRQVDGIALFDSAGEFVHYSTEERMRAAVLAPKRSPVPVLVNVSHSTLDGAVEMAQSAMMAGAAGVLLMPPYFFRYDQNTFAEFYRAFADQADIRIPLLLDIVPRFTNPVEPAIAAELIRTGVVQGIKDGSEDGEYLRAVISQGLESGVRMAGTDRIYAGARRQGAHGVVSDVASAIPELIAALNRAAAQDVGTDALEERVREFAGWMDRLPVPVAIKEAASLRGLKLGPHAVPLSPESQRTADQFREWFQGWLPTVLNEAKRT